MTLEDRFWSKVRKTETCWLWTGCRDKAGYGRINANRVVTGAHRVAYAMMVGEVPDGFELDHLCRTRHCVNPKHLEPVPHVINVRRGITGQVNRDRIKAITHCPRGHAYSGENVRLTPSRGYVDRRCRACGRERERVKRRAAGVPIRKGWLL